MSYKTFNISINNHIALVSFNRPEKANSLNKTSWTEMQEVFEAMHTNPDVRVIILHGEGKHFCGGIDLAMFMSGDLISKSTCEGRKREHLHYAISKLQANISAIEKCRKPVLAAVHRACVGAGVDIISACDMRYCTENAFFSIKEIDLGMVADVGTLQRLPKILNAGIVAELAYTGRKVDGEEALKIGLVNQLFADKDEMLAAVTKIAEQIASKSPLSIRGTKEMLLYTRDHSVDEALHFQASWNAAMLLSNDLTEAMQANMQKRATVFEG